jgi:hypothetical protein
MIAASLQMTANARMVLAAALVVVPVVSACGDDSSTATGGTGGATSSSVAEATSSGDSSSTTTGGGGEGFSCFPEETFADEYQAPVGAADGSCVDGDTRRGVDLCVSGDDFDSAPDFKCMKNVDDGTIVWLYGLSPYRVSPEWTPCPESLLPEGEPLPPPCFAAACAFPTLPVAQDWAASACTEAETREAFDCGGASSAWDESCCRRQPCDEGTCADGMVCTTITPPASFQECWGAPGNCGCGGLPGSPQIDVCFPE